MSHIDKKPAIRKVSVRLGIVMLLGALGMSALLASQDTTSRPRKEPVEAAAVARPQMTIHGPNEAVVGRRFTLEVIIANPTGQAMKDLEFAAELDGNLEQGSKARSHLEKIGSIAGENIHIVRLALTPTKKGPARLDIILRQNNGQMQQVQHVMPVFAADDAPQPADRPAGNSPLAVTVTTPKDVFADRAGMYLIRFVNTGSEPTQDKMEVVVGYGTISKAVHFGPGGGFGIRGGIAEPAPQAEIDPGFNPGDGGFRMKASRLGINVQNPTNPVRETRINLPALGPNESRTVAVMLTPRRVGEFRVSVNCGNQMIKSIGVQARFDPNVSLESMLPKFAVNLTPRLPKSLTEVFEISLEDRYSKTMKADEAFEQIAHMMDKVNHANAKKVDAFAAALLAKRADLTGVPMQMGDGCRLKPERASQFIQELSQLRVAMAQGPNGVGLASRLPNPAHNPGVANTSSPRIAAMMQVLGPEGLQMRLEMVNYLKTISTVESTQALASLAVFAEEDQIRQPAIDALKGRRDQDYSDILVRGLNYPWPAVAENASNAIVKLNRKDLIPQLVSTLERSDPRAPEAKDGKLVVREMVKVNHLRNCMLCHPPRSGDQNINIQAFDGKAGHQPLLAQVPIPNQPLPVSPGNGGGYGQFTVPDTLVRFDVTYLRQDFSVMLPVGDHQPWPQMQRFDFLVRTREITEKDAQTYRDLLRPAGAGDLSPYQRAAVVALRGLTGRDAAPNAPAWRELLERIRAEGKG
jgi:hypothetical protein